MKNVTGSGALTSVSLSRTKEKKKGARKFSTVCIYVTLSIPSAVGGTRGTVRSTQLLSHSTDPYHTDTPNVAQCRQVYPPQRARG